MTPSQICDRIVDDLDRLALTFLQQRNYVAVRRTLYCLAEFNGDGGNVSVVDEAKEMTDREERRLS